MNMMVRNSILVDRGAPKVRPVVYEPESHTYFAALTATGLTLTNGRKYAINRAIKRLKAAGLHKKVGIAYAFSADAFAIDMLGNYARSKIGTPTFSNNAVSSASVSNAYEWNVMLSQVDPTDHSMGFLARTGAGALSNSDQGAVGEDSSHRLLINSKSAGGTFVAASMCANITFGTATQAGGLGFNGISRHPSLPGTVYNYTNGIMRVSSATAAAASVSTNKLRDLGLGGGANASGRAFAASFYGKGLTHAEMCQLYAIIKSLDTSVLYGEPDIQDAGCGAGVVEADVFVVGLSVGAVIAAYQAHREGLTVAMIGEERDTSPEHIGFNPVSWIDATDPTTVCGISRAMITAANTLIGKSDATTQTGLSISSMWWNRISLQMLDVTRTGGTLPGAAIGVYFTEGLEFAKMVATSIGRECTELRSKCGRIFRPKNGRMIIINGDYDGNLFPLMGISYIKGTEARGSAPGEDLNGYDPTELFPFRDWNGNEYSGIDPYVTEDTPASGLLPRVIDLPGFADGGPDPTLQAMCYRLITTSLAPRMAPLTGGATLAPLPGYDPLDYEPLMRIFAAYAAAGSPHTAAMSDCYSTGNSIESGVEDWNNGPSGYSTDMGQLAAEWLFSETRKARNATIERLTNFTGNLAYHLLASGDSRIPSSLITSLQGRGLDTFWGVDPYPGHPLFFPPHPYKREARYQGKNAFNFSGNDTFMADGTTPRSIKTVACGSYRADKHTTRWVNVAGELFRQGGVDDDSAGGVDTLCPVPAEAIMPDKAECTNLMSPVVLFCTKVANSSKRMEPVFHTGSQASGKIAAMALSGAIAVQDFDYPTFRTAFLAVPDAVAPVIPQVN